MTISQESPHLRSHAKRHDGRERPVVCRLFIKTSTVSTFKMFLVAVRSFTSDSSLLQPTGVCNGKIGKSIFEM